MTDMAAGAGSGRSPGGAEPGLIYRRELMAALNRAAQKRVTIISAPAGAGKTSLLRVWANQPGQDCRIAFMTVRPGQHDMQLFWLTMLGAVRAAAGVGEGSARLPPATPGSSGSEVADKVLSELGESGDPFVLVIDDLHELSSPEAARAAHSATDAAACGSPRDRGHPSRLAAAPAQAAAGR
jgi:LuxR family maltose regulon positive regulatory protein